LVWRHSFSAGTDKYNSAEERENKASQHSVARKRLKQRRSDAKQTLTKEELRQASIERQSSAESRDSDKAREHPSAEHEECVDRDKLLEPFARGDFAHVCQHRTLVLAHLLLLQNAQRQERAAGVDERHEQPHVA